MHTRPVPHPHPRAGRAGRAGRRTAAVLATAALLASASLAGQAPASAVGRKPVKVAVTALSVTPSSGTPGASLAVRATVRNPSRHPVRKSTVVLRLSQDRSLDTDDRRLGSTRVGTLRARARKKVRGSVSVPTDAPAGTWYLLACVARSCRATAVQVTPPVDTTPQPQSGTLTGTLSFARSTPFEDGQVVDMSARVDVAMRYEGPPERRDELQSTGSTYTLNHSTDRTVTSGECQIRTTETGTGAGTLLESPDPYADEILADVALLDLSELSLTTFLRYSTSRTVTRSGDSSCSPGTQTTTATGLGGTSMTLTQVSRTASDITYRVSSFNDIMSTRSVWDRIDGTLTLHLA